MFKNTKKQFVNILKQDKQLKVDYKILDEEKIIKENSSSFLLDGESLSKDSISKLNILQNDIPNTYLASLITIPDQEVKSTEDIDTSVYESVKFDDKSSIAIAKNDILQFTGYFSRCGIDYIISPFVLLNAQIKNKDVKNSLNILIFDNVIYALIKDKDKNISKSLVHKLTPFEAVQESNFSEDELMGQRIYDEVYFLEVQQTLSDFVQQYYQENKDVEFLEETNIYYNINQISDEQLDSLNETLMTKVNYYQININDIIFDLLIKEDKQINFIDVREKKDNKSSLIWTALSVISILAVVIVIYLQMTSEIEKQKEPVKKKEVVKEVKKESVKPKEKVVKKEIIKFPDHLQHNSKILENTMMLFDVIPYDAILNEIEIDENSSTFVCNFLTSSTSNEEMKGTLLKIYQESKEILTHSNNAVLSNIITNKGILKEEEKISFKAYEEHQFLSIAKVTKSLEKIALKDSVVKYQGKVKDKYTVYKFTLTSLVNEPQAFFDFVNKINQNRAPLYLKYPLEFAKTNEGLSIKYNIEFYQLNKPSVKPIN